MIEIKDLKKQFGETCACDIPSFTVNDGDILGLVGNNGAGKTTLFRLILDLLKPDEGSVLIDNVNPAESEAWKQHVGAFLPFLAFQTLTISFILINHQYRNGVRCQRDGELLTHFLS